MKQNESKKEKRRSKCHNICAHNNQLLFILIEAFPQSATGQWKCVGGPAVEKWWGACNSFNGNCRSIRLISQPETFPWQNQCLRASLHLTEYEQKIRLGKKQQQKLWCIIKIALLRFEVRWRNDISSQAKTELIASWQSRLCVRSRSLTGGRTYMGE